MKTNLIFLKILSSYIHQRDFVPPDDTDWKEILYLSQIHSVSAIIYMAAGKYIKDMQLSESLKQDFLFSVNNSILQETEMENIIKKLTENNINHMLMKGYVLRNYYPDKEARTFGDIDFLINEADREKSHKLLIDCGFEYDKDHFIKQVYTYKKRNIILEVHTEIIYQELFLGFDYRGYFMESVKKMILVRKCTYELPKEDHFIYVMVHLAEHFYKSGVGIRMILDIAVFLNKYGTSMDMDYVNKEFEKIKLTSFVNIIYCLCNKYFDVNVKYTEINSIEETIILDYILCHGTFGYISKNLYDIDFYRKEENRLTVIRKRFFPDYTIMVQRNEWFRNGKKILLPYAWFRRWLEFVFNKNKRKDINQKIETLFGQGADSEKHNIMLNIVGLKY